MLFYAIIQLVLFGGFIILITKQLFYLMQKKIPFFQSKKAPTPTKKISIYREAPDSTHGRNCNKCIAGYEIEFPFNPYPAQIVLMFKILQSLKENKNSLLESPTGTGKSLALLCSTLAWQLKELENNLSAVWYEKKLKNKRLDVSVKPEQNNNNNNSPVTVKTDSEDSDLSTSSKKKRLPTFLYSEDSDDDFRPSKKPKSAVHSNTKEIKLKDGCIDKLLSYAATPPPHMPSSSIEPIVVDDSSNSMCAVECQKSCEAPQNSVMESTPPTKSNPTLPPPKEAWNDIHMVKAAIHRTPKIYYGTRTHQQIKQVVRELSTTAYRHTPMTILASRDHLCVNPDVLKTADRTEGCKKAVKLRSCPYYLTATTLGRQDYLKSQHLNMSWDIEDLVSIGKKHKACPYYATRYLLEEALIVFCPYNYLIDPIIKREMKFNLDGQIIVLDEAHNIENISREAASTQCTQSQLEAAVNELDSAQRRIIPGEDVCSTLGHLSAMLMNLKAWVCGQDTFLKKEGFESLSNSWLGVDIVKEFESFGLSHSTMQLHNNQLARLFEILYSNDRAGEDDESDIPSKMLSSNTITLLEWLFEVLNKLLSADRKYTSDYIVFITKKTAFINSHKQAENNRSWLSTKKQTWERTINFCCLNPAVAFGALASTANSIILTSGTLTPMTSFVSELSCEFKYQAIANHVIKPDQVWIGLIGTGPTGVRIEASYRGMEQLSVQDEIGRVLVSVCEKVPDGVLCFLPSYSVMDKLKDRWDINGVTSRLSDLKHIVWEPRGSGKASKFKEDMNSYFESITSGRGSLLLGVCRGKVSEGVDFADAQARAVMCVGIPFPNWKDLQVQQKREYNDRRRRSGHSNLLSGSQWYEVEAFRALNQALGRCIRHRNDWGSIILVDDRISRNSYIGSLSKWAREKVRNFDDFETAQKSLTEFIDTRTGVNIMDDIEKF